MHAATTDQRTTTWLADLVERNIVQCSGPFASGNGGLLIFKSDSIENLNALLLETHSPNTTSSSTPR
ncbi:hypothetical protein BKP42_57800 [Rhodococcus erythropolis]|nr:hypothetical protein BKP42_57800 [Rhodococcus erythropolis]